MNNIRYESTLRDKNKRREKGGLLGDKEEGNEEENEKILVQYIVLRWLDTVFKKLSYSLLNTFNFCTVKFK